ncbi:MAG TPA: hypothetical protein VF380_08840 [Solirubrobacteraceae bacterium]
MSLRPLALCSGLTLGDYLLWNWSLNSNHDVLALISGLSLPPLAVACAWLIALSVARLLARSGRLAGSRGAARAAANARRAAASSSAATEDGEALPGASRGRSGKLAA